MVNGIERLFEMELIYKQGLPSISSAESRLGEYIGSGEGEVIGPRIQGTVRWDLFESQGENLCQSNLRGAIETHDGERIEFDSLGYFMRTDLSNPNQWITSAAVTFKTTAGQYIWLNDLLATLHGEFDMDASRHRYQVYAMIKE